MTDTNRELRIEYVDLDDIRSADRNPKQHDIPTIRASMSRFGVSDVAAILNESTGRLVAGHGRITALREMHDAGDTAPAGVHVTEEGAWTVPVLHGVSFANEAEAEAFLLAHNRTTELGGWDHAELDLMISELDLTGTGYQIDDIDSPGTGDDPARDDEDHEPLRPPENPVTKPGDIWVIGPHRVICGSASDPDTVTELLNGATVNLAVTSPPYADRRKYDETTEFRPIPPDEYVEWFKPFAENVATHLADDGSWLVNIKPGVDGIARDLYVIDLIAAHVREWGWTYAEEFCWERNGVPKSPTLRLKNGFEPVHQFARGRWKFRPDHVTHETDNAIIPFGEGAGDTSWDGDHGSGRNIFAGRDVRKTRHGRRGGGASEDAQGSGYNDIGEYKTAGLAYPSNRLPTFIGTHEAVGHPAAYPVGLPHFLIRLFTDTNDTVYDPFLGSGSTIIAADQLGRTGYGIELSPGYTDLALARIQRRTGHTPTRNGKPHDFTTDQ